MRDVLVEGNAFCELVKQLFATGNKLRFRATGGSMLPLVADGAFLEVMPCAAQDIRVGDIALFDAGEGRLLAHRLVRRSSNPTPMFFFRGDALRRNDRPVSAEQVLGRVVALQDDHGPLLLAGVWFKLLGRAFVLVPPVARRLIPLIHSVRRVFLHHF